MRSSLCERSLLEESPRSALSGRREHPRRDRAARGARPCRRGARDRAGARRADPVPRRTGRARARSRGRSQARALSHPASPRTDVHWGDALPPRRRCPRAAAAEAGREPAVQHRDAGRRREPRAAAARPLVRDGAARGRRPILRAAADAGLRLRVGVRPARDGAHRPAPGLARGVPAEAECRVGPRRLYAHRPGSPASGQARRRGGVRHRRKTLANSLALAAVASREQSVAALGGDRPRGERPRRGARACRVRRAHGGAP